ncbi:telomeric repeat-binding factor 2-interacting protein 1 [Toxotes jaculatrix]|uniref:telomeric repeat-binding factor 2-interacting protein 1 n=1 Tax=Toxotes jaculatrix TaxID=941984 RepID=UPI001B3AF070|nr:telomeric repeat-binding factor 2-interacting protein 1 [Toxotes jaculatrix]XP_040888853.1 telomeric repeat-binding factor 2-interacting protein 1 [Toxotes jaculatrix]XP_040888854.1 telomeric repeat-binding factor 2-interacting protein 1 [Toxotes jaculatrix]
MSSKQNDVGKPNISPVLFMSVDGEAMSFFLRPGPVKRKLQPLIKSGGGMLCSVQQPGAILLIDPEERGSIPETTAHWYVSTQYIYDCIEKDEQLNVEDYRLNPEVVPGQSARLNNSKGGFSGGRVAYSPEDDAAILNYVSKHKTETGGNRLWQEMEKQRVTSHSWQSMKYRYRVQLAKKQPEVEEVKTSEEETKKENQETDVQKPSSEDAAPPQTHSPASEPLQTHSEETDLTQTDAQPIPPESTQSENVEADTSASPQPEEPCVEAQTDGLPIPAESTEPETAQPQTTISPQTESVPEDPLQPLPNNFTPKKTKEKQRASPRLEQRRITRRQLELEVSSSPEPNDKTLRSSAEQVSSSPQPAKKTKSLFQHTADQPPSKRARGKSVATVAESQHEENAEATVSETPQPGENKKKRKLGILELATKEFEDSSEDEAPDLQNPSEVAEIQPTSTGPPLPSSDTAVDSASTQSNPEPGPSLQQEAQQTQALSSNCVPDTGCPVPAASDPAATEAVHATSRAHLFIFDTESQEEDSQSLIGDGSAAPSNPQLQVNKDAALSLTQVQLEEDKQQIIKLMNQTNQDLVSVTKALLKTSGDFSAALDLLLNPSSISRPFWNHHDDGLLLSADPVVRQQLQEKYGEKEVAKRIVFLEVEG